MPSLRGRERRLYFNRTSGWMILGFGLGGAMLGLSLAGLLVAGMGFGIGLVVGGTIAERGRFFRG